MPAYDSRTAYAPSLRRGDRGPGVSALQDSLIALGRRPGELPIALRQSTGEFNAQTEEAVMQLQRQWKLLPPNGIADSRTQQVLSLAAIPVGRFHDAGLLANSDILHILSTMAPIAESGETPRPVSAQVVSPAAKEWMFVDEGAGISPEVTAYLHYPGNRKNMNGNSSGVTLGPGYDMAMHLTPEIEKMLKAVGVSADIAERVAREAVGLQHERAYNYAEQHGAKGDRLIHLTADQQKTMQSLYLPSYESYPRKWVTVPLLQREYESLVSFSANAEGSIVPITSALNRGNVAEALGRMLRRVPAAGSSITAGMRLRRGREVEWFLAGRYTSRVF